MKKKEPNTPPFQPTLAAPFAPQVETSLDRCSSLLVLLREQCGLPTRPTTQAMSATAPSPTSSNKSETEHSAPMPSEKKSAQSVGSRSLMQLMKNRASAKAQQSQSPTRDESLRLQRGILDATRQLGVLEGRSVARLSLNKIVIALDQSDHPESVVMDEMHKELMNEAATSS